MAVAAAAAARAQSFDVEHPQTIVAGTPPGARAERGDAARTGLAASPLPAGPLRIAWAAYAGDLVEHGPLVDGRGDVYVLGAHGAIVALGPDGGDLWRIAADGARPGPGALLSDGTLVYVTAGGEAIAVRGGRVRWRARVEATDSAGPAPLPLADGGVVVATPYALVALDRDGAERARARLDEPAGSPLLSALGDVIVVGASGQVWAWRPGAVEARRAGDLGPGLEGSAALADDHTVVAVVAGGGQLAALDLRSRERSVRATAVVGVWRGSPAMLGSTAYVIAESGETEAVVGIDPAGRELGRVPLSRRPPRVDGDAPVGTAATATSRRAAPLLVDRAGTVAFGTREGALGVVVGLGSDASGSPGASAAGHATTTIQLPELCGAPGRPAGPVAPVAGLAPAPGGRLVATCATGTILALEARKVAP
jgi:hypothetical protein